MNFWSKLRGTTSSTFGIGDGRTGNKSLQALVGLSATPPEIRYNTTLSRWEYTYDGTNYRPLGERELTDITPSGVVNGVNKVFVTPNKFVHEVGTRSVRVFVGGSRKHLTVDYTVSESGGGGTGYDTITFSSAPTPPNVVRCDYYVL